MKNTTTSLELDEFTRYLHEIENQPAWRSRADREMDYVDGNQLDAEVLQRQRALGMPPAIEPLIGPAIEAVLGLEAKTRIDWRLTADHPGQEGEEVAAAQKRISLAALRADARSTRSLRGWPMACHWRSSSSSAEAVRGRLRSHSLSATAT